MTYKEVIEKRLFDLYERLGEMMKAEDMAFSKFPLRLQIDLLESILSEVAYSENPEDELRLIELQNTIREVEGVPVPRPLLEKMSCEDMKCEQEFYSYLLSK